MKCVICKHGNTRAGTSVVTLQRNETIVVIKSVPADICDNCGEYYLSSAVTQEVMARAEAAVKSGAELEILRYAA
jgi:YgiT-type zinc finger domain-containing protein